MFKSVLLTIASVLGLSVALAPSAQAQQQCPAVVVVAARGSGQNSNVQPTWYGGSTPSNGWEGETIRAFLRTAEARYRETHGGASVMNSVHVLGLTPEEYPATYPSYEVPKVAAPQTVVDIVRIVVQYAGPVLNTAVTAATQFRYSLQTGRSGVMRAINNYETQTGCKPGYILVGYSQGAMVLATHEKELAKRGQLAGVVYMGNPLTNRFDRSTVGVPGASGILGDVSIDTRGTDNRVNYCLPADGVCNATIGTLRASESDGGNHGRYFLRWSEWDAQVADAFGRFVDSRRG